MNNSLPLAFIAILLALVMYFVILSAQQSETGLDIGKSTTCTASCCLAKCETHSIEVADEQRIRFNSSVLSPEQFATHLLQAHKDCEIGVVHVHATASLRHEVVMNITSRILEIAPQAKISWDNVAP